VNYHNILASFYMLQLMLLCHEMWL